MQKKRTQCRINKHYSRISFFSVFAILILLFASIIFFVQNDKQDKLVRIGDQIIKNFREGLDYEMVDLLSFSMALSEDGELKNALTSDDEGKGYSILNHISERFKKYTHLTSLRIQVLTPEFYIFARSWNEGFEGMPIWWFRDDLDKLKENQKPKVGMETGRLLTFKATVPIRSGKKILGYLEVIKFIDEFSAKLQKKGIALFALMDEKYLEQASLMRDFPVVNKYVISNQNFNQQFLSKIKKLDWKVLMQENYRYQENIFYIHEPMYNGKGKKIGIYLLAIPEDVLSKYEKEKDTFSFFTQFSDEDIEKVVDAWQNPNGSFRNSKDKELIAILPKLRNEDKIKLELEAKNILRTYSKNELIDIIIENKHNEKKVGEIK
jgi:hypothetical protein